MVDWRKSGCNESLQRLVLGSYFFEKGDVWVRILPDGKKIFVVGESLRSWSRPFVHDDFVTLGFSVFMPGRRVISTSEQTSMLLGSPSPIDCFQKFECRRAPEGRGAVNSPYQVDAYLKILHANKFLLTSASPRITLPPKSSFLPLGKRSTP